MRLITKVNLALFGVVAISACLNFATLKLSVMPSFAALEEQAAERNQSRVMEAIQLQKDRVANSTGDYALWDDTYDFMLGTRPDYEEKNVTAESLKTLGINYFMAVDMTGKVRLDRGYAYGDNDAEPITLLPADQIPLDDPLLARPGPVVVATALIRSERGLVVVASSPIYRSDRSGEQVGTLILGRLLDIDAIRSATSVDFSLLPEPVLPATAASEETSTVDKHDPLLGPDGKPVAMIVSHTPRDITAVGRKTILTTQFLLLAGASVLLIALGYTLRQIVIRRIERLRTHIIAVAASGHLDPMQEDGRNDELSETLQSFNTMARQLDELRDRLRREDYDHGAADQAAGLLHNVRNAISPISVLAWDLAQGGDAPWKQNLAKALDQLKDPTLPADRAQKLQQFIAMSAARLMKEEGTRQEEVGALVTMLRHVDDILKEQDHTAQRERAVDSIDISAALRHAFPLIERRDKVTVDLSGLKSFPVLGHKVPLEQVLGNLVVNAAEAIEASARGHGVLRITSRQGVAPDGSASVEIELEDDGAGIDPVNLGRLFEKGFTTKSGTKRGVGLHWCANAVNAMGGRLMVESQGPDCGALVRIILPQVPLTSASDPSKRAAETAKRDAA
jgi:sensor domain CHASE-containing protein